MDLSGSGGTGAGEMATTVSEASPRAEAGQGAGPKIYPGEVDHSRD